MEIWIILSLTSAALSSVERVLHKFNISKVRRIADYSTCYLLCCSLFCLFFAIEDLKKVYDWPKELIFFMISSGIFWASFSLLTFHAERLLEASVKAGVSRIRILWSILISIIIFDEQIDFQKGSGALLIAIAPLLLIAAKNKVSKSGLALEILATLCIAVALSFDKFSLNFVNAPTVAFCSFAISSIISLVIKRSNIAATFTKNGTCKISMIALAAMISVGSHVLLLNALSMGIFYVVTLIYMTAPILTVLLAIVFLKERKDIIMKFFVVSLALFGSGLVIL